MNRFLQKILFTNTLANLNVEFREFSPIQKPAKKREKPNVLELAQKAAKEANKPPISFRFPDQLKSSKNQNSRYLHNVSIGRRNNNTTSGSQVFENVYLTGDDIMIEYIERMLSIINKIQESKIA